MGGGRSRLRAPLVGTAAVLASDDQSPPLGPGEAMTSENLRAWIVANDAPGVELVRCPANTPDVQSSAKALGVAVDDIVKSIVLCCDGAFAVCVTNGTARVDHKKIARRLGVANKRVRLATRDETLAHAGFAPGTVPPFGHRVLPLYVAIGRPDAYVYGGKVDVEVRWGPAQAHERDDHGRRRDDDVCEQGWTGVHSRTGQWDPTSTVA